MRGAGHDPAMRIAILSVLIVVSAGAAAQPAQAPVQPGEWTATVTVREMVVPGAPSFLLSMAIGKSRDEKKCITPELAARGAVSLLAPDPKANCTVERQQVAGGRYEQILSCPQRRGTPMRVVRQGSYDANGLRGTAVMTGPSEKGAVRIAADQVVRRTGATCRR